ncbi:MAG: DUF1499 domain-containing protein [Balneola sp.]|nr:MAG: DUF1499 domain-containing protein [Balneola sp.]
MKNSFITIILFSIFAGACANQSHSPEMSDLTNPLPPCPSTPNCVRTAASFGEVDSMKVFEAIQHALQSMKAEEITVADSTLDIHAVFRIPVFGWRDDVNVSIQQIDNVTVAFFRSASREGTWDIWANSIRVRKLIRRTNNFLLQ